MARVLFLVYCSYFYSHRNLIDRIKQRKLLTLKQVVFLLYVFFDPNQRIAITDIRVSRNYATNLYIFISNHCMEFSLCQKPYLKPSWSLGQHFHFYLFWYSLGFILPIKVLSERVYCICYYYTVDSILYCKIYWLFLTGGLIDFNGVATCQRLFYFRVNVWTPLSSELWVK